MKKLTTLQSDALERVNDGSFQEFPRVQTRIIKSLLEKGLLEFNHNKQLKVSKKGVQFLPILDNVIKVDFSLKKRVA